MIISLFFKLHIWKVKYTSRHVVKDSNYESFNARWGNSTIKKGEKGKRVAISILWVQTIATTKPKQRAENAKIFKHGRVKLTIVVVLPSILPSL